MYGVFNDVDIRSEARFDELRNRVHAHHAGRQPRVLRHAAAARAGRLLGGRARQSGADDLAVRSRGRRRLQLRLSAATTACRSSPTATSTSPTRRPGRCRRSACARRARPTRSGPRSFELAVGRRGCDHAEGRPAVQEVRVRDRPRCSARTARRPNQEAIIPANVAATPIAELQPHRRDQRQPRCAAPAASTLADAGHGSRRVAVQSLRPLRLPARHRDRRSATTTTIEEEDIGGLRAGRLQDRSLGPAAARQSRRALRRDRSRPRPATRSPSGSPLLTRWSAPTRHAAVAESGHAR